MISQFVEPDQVDFIHFRPGVGLTIRFNGRDTYLGVGHDRHDAVKLLEAASRSKHYLTPRDSSEQIDSSEDPNIDALIPETYDSNVKVSEPPSLLLPEHIDTLRLSSGKALDWMKLVDFLSKSGCELKELPCLGETLGLIGNPHLIKNHVVVHSISGVISEGKGPDHEAATNSAVAEAVERLIAANPEPEKVFTTSKSKLAREGFLPVPLDLGPRDCFSDEMVTDWVQGIDFYGHHAAIPAELAYYDYIPRNKIQCFPLQHTSGLAAGATLGEAAFAGVLEVLERDAYWITMRCKLKLPRINIINLFEGNSVLLELLEQLSRAGLKAHCFDSSLDWQLPIVHIVIEDVEGRIPAFSHGMGAHLQWKNAAHRALLEAIQVRAGMIHQMQDVLDSGDPIDYFESLPGVAWSDPMFKENLEHLIGECEDMELNSFPAVKSQSASELIENLIGSGFHPFVFPLGEKHGLHVVRVFVSHSTQPDPTLGRISSRLQYWRRKVGLPGFFTDPILL